MSGSAGSRGERPTMTASVCQLGPGRGNAGVGGHSYFAKRDEILGLECPTVAAKGGLGFCRRISDVP